jgi:hypothetical protein
MTESDKREAQNQLVPGLAEGEWGRKPGDGGDAYRVQPSMTTATTTISSTAAAASQFKLEPEVYDGASEEDEDMDVDEADEEPVQIDDEGQVQMEGEMEEFLRFTREALGLSEEQYQDILNSRRERGGETTQTFRFPPIEAQH